MFSFFRFSAIIILFFFFTTLTGKAQNNQDVRLSGSYQNVSLPSLLSDLESKYPLTFYYNQDALKDISVSIVFNDSPLTIALERLLKETPYTFILLQKNSIVFVPKEEMVRILGGKNMDNKDLSDINIVGKIEELGKVKKPVVSGIVTDGKTGEPIIGATLMLKNTNTGVTSDVHGKYSLVLTPGTHQLIVSSLGYETNNVNIKIYSNGSLNIELFEKSIKLDEVIIQAQGADRNVKSNQMSLVEMDKKTIKQLPPILGERDVIKSMTMMPGVKSVGEFGSDINVRGGGGDQNLFIVEGAPLFNTSHVLGLLSVINPDAVNNVTLYKGFIPANYGERVSSVMDIQMKEGNNKEYHASGGVGLLNSRLSFEGPIYKNKASFFIGGRTSYSDWLLKEIPDINLKNSSAKFYDFNCGLDYIVNDNNKISFFGYTSNDDFNYASELGIQYKNLLASLKWNHSYGSSLYSSLVLTYSKYNVNKKDISDPFYKSNTETSVEYKGAKINFTSSHFSKHTLDFGAQGIIYDINPGEKTPLDTVSLVPSYSLLPERALETAIYAADKIDITNNFNVSLGLRWSNYFYLGPNRVFSYNPNVEKSVIAITDTTYYSNNKVIKWYNGLEPRVVLKYLFNEATSVKISYNRNYQYISLISYSSISTPDDVWKLSNTHIKPIICDQFAIGLFKNFNQNTIETSIEAYYKKIQNAIEYKNGAQVVLNEHVETELINSEGQNFGVELYLKKSGGIIDGWISYTFSRTFRQTSGSFPQEMINNNAIYPSSFDKPHDFTLMGTYHYNRRLRASCTFNYSTGRAVTLPEQKYYYNNYWIINYSDRNKYRLPDYHRLDLSISIDESLRIKKKWKGSWTFSVINVYARRNAYSVFYKKNEVPSKENNYQKYSIYKLYLIGIPLPTITYNFIF